MKPAPCALLATILLTTGPLACGGATESGAPAEGGDGEEGGDGSAGDGGDDGDDGDDDGMGDPDPIRGSWTFEADTVTVSATEDAGGFRTYTLASTHPMRDSGPSERSFSERAGDPLLRSGVLLTDALFAMAVEEARQNAVSEVSDGSFDGAQPCDCYQTGALWSWVWTRDLAYATELGLAWLDPDRAANSLLFKLSEPKDGGGPRQIVQDTGTGGSWPVSTDRVAWARGAMAVLRYSDNEALRSAAIEAMQTTAAFDRHYAWDPRDGLYRGETSFLDWREQSYPAWTAGNVVHIGMSKALGTNLDHLFLLRSLEALTGEAHGADDLAVAIDAAFWDGEVYRSYLSTELDPGPAHQQDLLATSLAVLDLGTHPEALGAYPHGPYGPPVIWPQQQRVPVYHNRAIWPFVTAYSVHAARQADNGAVFDAGLDSLVRGAALNLSHMENLELATGTNWLEDGETSGPVVNSRRQLWSVAGFLGAVAHGVFGLQGEAGVLSGDPILPGGGWFLPGATLQVGDRVLSLEGADPLSEGSLRTFDTADWQQLFGARSPTVTLFGAGDTVSLGIEGEAGARFDVYRDGQLVAEDVSSPWTDSSGDIAGSSPCYAVVARLVLPSQPSEPSCWWGDGHRRIQTVPVDAFTVVGGLRSSDHGRAHIGSWGAPGDSLSFSITPDHTGEHLLQLVFGNGAGGVDTGVTAGVKWLEVTDPDGVSVASGAVLMPHLGTWGAWADSSFVPATLSAGTTYRVNLSDGWNMSYLAHYRPYLGERGGGSEPSNDVNIAEAKLLFLR